MRYFLFFGFISLFFSCNDGDLQIETVDFDSATIDNCTTVTIASENILFKINGEQALILTLPANILKNEITTDAIISSVGESGPSKLSYRIFSGSVTKNYFCDDIPQITPTVTSEIIAKSGEVIINTILLEDGVTYQHTVELNNITLETSAGSRITDLTINNYGTVTTKP